MIGTFESIKKNFRLRPAQVTIDNWVFRLHYRATTLLLLAGCVVVSSKQYVGEHIACVTDIKAVPEKVMNTFCFFTATFTLVGSNETLAHPGVGPEGAGQHVTRHNFYQWVPFVLFGQALAYYLPHYVWKRQEGSRLCQLTFGLRYAAYSVEGDGATALKAPDGATVPSREDAERHVGRLRGAFLTRLHVHQSWALWLVLCELLNAINLPLQLWLTDRFLSGGFALLGPHATPATLDAVFPKVTKCTFHKYGPSGTLQAHDALCVLALNVVNEKIFVVLWWWYAVLAVATLGALVWRALAAWLHSRSVVFNRWVFSRNGGLNPWSAGLIVTRRFHFSDWLFLCYLTDNVDARIAARLLLSLAEDLVSTDEDLLIDLHDPPDDFTKSD